MQAEIHHHHHLTLETSYWVNLNGISVSQPGSDDNLVFEGVQTFLLDSGYTLSGFPTPIFNSLLEAFPSAIAIPGSNQYSVECSLAEVDGFLDFTFGSTVINVPFADFVWQQGANCYLGAFQSDSK